MKKTKTTIGITIILTALISITLIVNTKKENVKSFCITIIDDKYRKVDTCIFASSSQELKEKLEAIKNEASILSGQSQPSCSIHPQDIVVLITDPLPGKKREYTIVIDHGEKENAEVIITQNEDDYIQKCELLGRNIVIKSLQPGEKIGEQIELLLNKQRAN
ncbi:MAG TPA: hypothetical protein VNX01_00795 [Bacteroidia bacterium]|nr:hypothetical protein [Bacteroidia bacterium]